MYTFFFTVIGPYVVFTEIPYCLFSFFWIYDLARDVIINREPVENRLKYVTIQIGWDAKQITIQLGVGVYMNVRLRGTYCL